MLERPSLDYFLSSKTKSSSFQSMTIFISETLVVEPWLRCPKRKCLIRWRLLFKIQRLVKETKRRVFVLVVPCPSTFCTLSDLISDAFSATLLPHRKNPATPSITMKINTSPHNTKLWILTIRTINCRTERVSKS